MRRVLLSLFSTVLASPALALIASDSIQITDANGTVLTQTNGQPAAGSLLEADESGSVGILTLGLTGTISSAEVSAGLQEPGSVGLMGLSDSVFIVRQAQNNLSVTFASDAEGPGVCDPAIGGPDVCMAETGLVQDLTPLLFPAGGAPFRVKIQSDTEVPEPSTALILGVGLGVLSVVRRRGLRAWA
jgi:hypothetical protein